VPLFSRDILLSLSVSQQNLILKERKFTEVITRKRWEWIFYTCSKILSQYWHIAMATTYRVLATYRENSILYSPVFSRVCKSCIFTRYIRRTERWNWLKFCATRQDVPGLTHNTVRGNFQVTYFFWPHSMKVWSTQPLAEISTKGFLMG